MVQHVFTKEERCQSLAIRHERKLTEQEIFLATYLELGWTGAAKAAGVNEFSPGHWLIRDPDFKEEFERLKAIKNCVNEEKEEEFLHYVGIGRIPTGSGTGLGMPNVVAAKMSLVAKNPKKWSEKMMTEKIETRKITHVIMAGVEAAPRVTEPTGEAVEGEFREVAGENGNDSE